MLNNDLIIYLISGGTGVFVGLVLLIGWLHSKKAVKKLSYEEQLADLTQDISIEEPKKSFISRWNSYWNKLFDNVGFARKNAGIEVIVIWLILSAIIGLFLKNFLSGAAVSIILIATTAFFLKNASNKRDIVIGKQLPGFIFALKANIEARNTPEQAFLNVVEDIPEPLYDEIISVKRGILASRSFPDSLIELKEKTSSRDLRFLSACILQATESGGDIKDQLITIQNILEREQEVNDEINKGYRTASPVLKLATFLIPGSLIAMILLDEGAQNFWFKEPLSWIFFVVIVILYVVAIVYTRNQVDKLRKF